MSQWTYTKTNIYGGYINLNVYGGGTQSRVYFSNKDDSSNLYATNVLIEEQDKKNIELLDSITRRYIIASKLEIDFEKYYPDYMKWLREFVPEHNQPLMFWRKFLDYLNSKDIYFKDQKNKE